MTQDIDPTPRHGNDREPSSASLDIARLKERHNALKANVEDMSETMGDIKALLLTHITSSGERHSQLLATFNQHNLEDAVVHQRALSHDERISELEADKKGWAGVGLGVGGAIAGAWALIKTFTGGAP